MSGGERTVDEMAHANKQIIYITDDDYKRLLDERRQKRQTQN